MEGKIREVFKFEENNSENFIYSMDTNTTSNDLVDRYYKYFLLTVKDNCPTIKKIQNPIDIINNIQNKFKNIPIGSYDYLKFLAYLQMAENEILIKMRK